MVNKTRYLDLLSKLIEFDTSNPPGNELVCANFLKIYLEQYGFQTKIQVNPTDPNRGNIIATIGNPNGKSLIYNGHLDVVPASQDWTSDPFSANILNNKLYGRGSCDMKGGIVTMIEASLQLIEEGFNFENGQLILVFVYDEELHDLGVKHYIDSEDFIKADFAIISEPSNLDLCIAHRGVVRYTLSILGKSTHAGVPSEGINAITNAAIAIESLKPLMEKLSRRTHEILPPPTLTPTTIHGGEKDNIVPGKIDIQIDRRTLPDESIDFCQSQITAIMENLKMEYKDFNYKIEPYVQVDAGYVSKDSELVNICASTYSSLFNDTVNITDFSGCNDQNFFINAGIPTVVFGPGNLNVAHTVDEYVPIEDLKKSIKFFKELAKNILS